VPLTNDHSPDVTFIYVWLSRNADGIEGVVQAPGPDGSGIPLVLTDQGRARKLIPIVEGIARARQMRVRLVRFERLDTIDHVDP
jgi:hypothetical protein